MSWEAKAACREMDPEVFFPVGSGAATQRQVAYAKSVCQGCPVRSKCLEEAYPDGIWGGLSEDERRELPVRPKNYPQITSDVDAGVIGMVERGESRYAIARYLKSRMSVADARIAKLRERGLLDHVDA